ncbi:MAG: alpha/beta hydrolase [Micrococcaceae bacterium]
MRKIYLTFSGTLLVLFIVVGLAYRYSPWADNSFLASALHRSAKENVKIAQSQTADVTNKTNIQYSDKGRFTVLDIMKPKGQEQEKLPVVIWIHGGAWTSGKKEDVNPYLKMLTVGTDQNKGYAGISLNYPLAPDYKYPAQIEELNESLNFLKNNQDKYNIDMSKVAIAGDSAGAQLASQLAALITNPSYAKQLGIAPGISKNNLKGVVLNCGVFNLAALNNFAGERLLDDKDGIISSARDGLRKTTTSESDFVEMSTINHTTSQFPPTLISSGNGDALTKDQSKPFAKKLKSQGVKVQEEFFNDAIPTLPHEYQFDFNYSQSSKMFVTTQKFLSANLGN